jgi:hypothetical protein
MPCADDVARPGRIGEPASVRTSPAPGPLLPAREFPPVATPAEPPPAFPAGAVPSAPSMVLGVAEAGTVTTMVFDRLPRKFASPL